MTSLLKEDVDRYSRQLLLPEVGVRGQGKLKESSVLIVGAGGLGCPAAIYLAAAGIGKLGIVDYDEVEMNNLHRQVSHTEASVGLSKAQSLVNAVQRLNSAIDCIGYQTQLTSSNALSIIEKYDIVVDATDNMPTRYLLNDACVLSKKPLVSGSALRFEGQLTIYNHAGGPCYRCLHPIPAPPEVLTNCSEGGVMGPVPGTIGTLQALEVIKIASGIPASYAGKLLLFDGLSGEFRRVQLRMRQKGCCVCGENPTINQLQDYEAFCGTKACDKTQNLNLLKDDQRIDCVTYKQMLDTNVPHFLVDVREPLELEICSLPHSYNLPINKIKDPTHLEKLKVAIKQKNELNSDTFQVVVVCRRGNDSQLAVTSLTETLHDMNINLKDLRGGLYSWANDVDPHFPLY